MFWYSDRWSKYRQFDKEGDILYFKYVFFSWKQDNEKYQNRPATNTDVNIRNFLFQT